MKHNPDWKVMFYYPKSTTVGQTWESFENKHEATYKDYTKEVFKLHISKTQIDFVDYGFSNSVSEVHKADFIRWKLLSSIGGLWSDMDILYFRPITNLLINRPENKHKDTVVSISEYGHSIGFMMANYDNQYFKKISDEAFDNFNSESYQSIGSELCNELFPEVTDIPGNPVDLGMEAVYSIDANVIERIFDVDNDTPIPIYAIGLHWFNGHPLAGKFLNETNGGLQDIPDNVIGNLIKRFK
jgi:hypothetical protein